jgi:hypothetical protein
MDIQDMGARQWLRDRESGQHGGTKELRLHDSDPSDPHVGFIAEDVPDLVAEPGRKSVSAVDIVAVLTKVVQEQQDELAETKEALKTAQEKIRRLEAMQERLGRVESILANVAAARQPDTTEKVSLK